MEIRKRYATYIIILLLAVGLYLLIQSFLPVSHLPSDEACLDSFDSFAFTFPNPNGREPKFIPPLDPWVPINSIDVDPQIDVSHYGVMTVRPADDQDELWFSNRLLEASDPILVYHIARNEFEILTTPFSKGLPTSAQIFYSSKLNNVAMVGLETSSSDPTDVSFSLWAFDHDLKRFSKKTSVSLPFRLASNMTSNWRGTFRTRLSIIDENDKFWIFFEDDAIYTIDFENESVVREKSLKDFVSIPSVEYGEGKAFYFRAGNLIYENDIHTNTIVEVPFPFVSFGLNPSLVDSAGTMWTSNSVWYRPYGGEVVNFHPRPQQYARHIDELDEWRYYSLPSPFMETSDGRIWFVMPEGTEMWRAVRSGMAWFDPVSKEGCWFTHEVGPLRETSNGNLWLLIDGTLYAYRNN